MTAPTQVVVGDFETYYKPGTYSLAGGKKLSTLNYIMDERFTAQSLATVNLSTGEKLFSWYDEIPEHIESLGLHGKLFVAHNCYFDAAILAWRFGVVPAGMACTRLMSMALLGTSLKSHSLGFVAEALGCAPKLKSMLNEFAGVQHIDGDPLDPTTPAGRMRTYNVQDTDTTVQVFAQLASRMPASQWWHMDWALRQLVDPVLRLDKPMLDSAAEQMTVSDERLYKGIGIPKSHFTSSSKFSELLEQAGCKVPLKWSERQKKDIPAISKGDPEFQDIVLAHQLPAVRNLGKLRLHAASNIQLTRARSMAANADVLPGDRWPVHILFSGAMMTHRPSGSDGSGCNILNLPRSSFLRNAIKPPVGHRLYVADQNAFELRIARQMSEDTRALDVIYGGGDLYCEFAAEVYKRPIAKATDPVERQVGKVAELSLGYGTGHKKLTNTLRLQGVDMDEVRAKQIVDLFRYDVHRPVSDCWSYFDAQVIPRMMRDGEGYVLQCAPFISVDKHALVLPSGLRIQYHGLRHGGEGLEFVSYSNTRKTKYDRLWSSKCFQHCCQSLANEILSVQKRQIEEEVGCRVVLDCYDELGVVVPVQDDAAMVEIGQRVDQIMCRSPSFWPELQLKNEGAYGDTYGAAK